MVLKLGHFGKQIGNNWEVLKCGAGETWRSVGTIVCKMKQCYVHRVKKVRHILKGKRIGHILVRICLLKRVID